jgi:hypothetical protein
MKLTTTAWRAIALGLAVLFYVLALRADFDAATAPRSLTHTLFGNLVPQFAHPLWLSAHFWLRKVYSVIAFTIVGFAAHKGLGPSRWPVRRAALLVGAYSLCIEIGQRTYDGYEPELESAFDVGCGALGGWLAVILDARLGTAARSAGAG